MAETDLNQTLQMSFGDEQEEMSVAERMAAEALIVDVDVSLIHI